jgi:NADH-quinone oxidoreductase subunit N
LFAAAYESGAAALVLIAVIASAIAAFFYVRVIVLMFFTEPQGDEVSVVIPSSLTQLAIALCVTATVMLGVMPQPVLDLLDQAFFLR